MENDPLARLQKLAEVAGDGLATTEEVAHGFMAVVSAIREYIQPLFDRLSSAESAVQDDRRAAEQRVSAVEQAAARKHEELARQIRTVELTLRDQDDEPDEEAIIEAVLERIEIPTPEPGNDGSPDTPVQVRDKLESLSRDERLDVSAIKGISELMTQLEVKPTRTIFGVPSRGVFLHINGIKKGLLSNLNVIGSGGATVAYSKVNGQDTLTITASGGGVTVETPPEAVDASRTQFTVSAQPKWMVADGTTYYEGAGYSYSSLSVTFDIEPSQFARAII